MIASIALNRTVRRRLISGFFATALGPIITAILQVTSVPVYLRAWGGALYGEWLILSAAPMYFALSDIGFASVAANDMTIRVAAGDRSGAVETFQSTWVLISLLSALMLTGVLITTPLIPLNRLLNCVELSPAELPRIFVILSAYSVVTLQNTLITAGFRCDGRYAVGAALSNAARLFETLAAVAAAAAGAGPYAAAAVLLAARMISTALSAAVMHRVLFP